MQPTRWSTRAVSLVAAVVLVVGSGSAAVAETPQEGLWYFDTYGVQDAHDAGFIGEGMTIAVMDSQINLDVPTLKGADIEVLPSKCWNESGDLISPTSTSMGAHHGTNVASFIVGTGAGYPGQTGVKGVAPRAKLLYFMATPNDNADNVVDCLTEDGKTYETNPAADFIDLAVAKGAEIISVSLNLFPNLSLVQAVARAEHQGVVIVGGLPNTYGAGNTDLNLA